MSRKILLFLILSILSLICACERSSTTSEKERAGTCIPITYPDEFIILSWHELVDISADSMLEEFKDPSAEWRLRKFSEAGFNAYFDYRLNSIKETEAPLEPGDKVGTESPVAAEYVIDEGDIKIFTW